MRTAPLATLAILLASATAAPAGETLVIAGAGPSTQVVSEFFLRFSGKKESRGFYFMVPPRSINHAGGVHSTAENIFGRTGRPLTPDERGGTRAEIPLARIPVVFVRDAHCGVDTLTREDLALIFDGSVTNWRELGGADLPIKLVGRERGEAALAALVHELPEIEGADFDLVLRKDHQLVQLMGTVDHAGVLGFGAASNFAAEDVLVVEGLAAGLTVGLVYDLKNADHPLVGAVRKFAASAEWAQLVTDLDLLPPAGDS